MLEKCPQFLLNGIKVGNAANAVKSDDAPLCLSLMVEMELGHPRQTEDCEFGKGLYNVNSEKNYLVFFLYILTILSIFLHHLE
jgi:hypothetical protein